MDALKLLHHDHERIGDLFADFKSAKDADDSPRMHSLHASIFEELETHNRIEENVFYPAVRDLDGEVSDTVAEGIQEHHVVKVLMREIEPLKGEDTFVAKMTMLIENVEHHIEEEESELFTPVRKKMTAAQLDQLGDELDAAKADG